MRKFFVFTLSLLAFCMFNSCEKAYIGDESDEKKEENIGNDNGDEWYEEDVEHAGGDDGEFSLGDVVDVNTFKSCAIYTQVWVEGYIVGAATGANQKYRYEFGPDFSFDTAILMADSTEADDISEVISVCLTNCSKDLRAKVNLRDHPENKGKRIAVFGFQDKYLKITGIKKIDAYEFPLE